MLVPSEYTSLVPLSVVDQVTPVPEVVLTVTVKTPVVALSPIYVFSTELGTITFTLPVIVPVNFNT